MAKKIKHGLYFLENKKGFFIFNSRIRKGRAFLNDGRVVDLTMKKHPKIIKGIVTKGERHIASTGRNDSPRIPVEPTRS